jgi:hypothetical protein
LSSYCNRNSTSKERAVWMFALTLLERIQVFDFECYQTCSIRYAGMM